MKGLRLCDFDAIEFLRARGVEIDHRALGAFVALTERGQRLPQTTLERQPRCDDVRATIKAWIEDDVLSCQLTSGALIYPQA